MDSTERPQERLCRLGSSALSDAELLAMILRSGTKEFNVLELAKELLKEAGTLNNLLYFTIDDFKKIRALEM